MKFDWKKEEKELYGVKNKPVLVKIPPQQFITIKGTGDPNQAEFAQRVGVLYSLAYPIKMRYKKYCLENPKAAEELPYEDFAVYPLEGVWTSSNPQNPLDKDCFVYTIMIRQPEVITREMFEAAMEVVAKKKPDPLLAEIQFETIDDGDCVQMRHDGSFDDEPASFAIMDAFAAQNNLTREKEYHREIYLNNARKTQPAKRKTILRYKVK